MTVEPVEDKKPMHLHFLNSRLKWDWRKENAVELILLVFLLTFFFALPRVGCGITKVNDAQATTAITTPTRGQIVEVPPARGLPEG